MLYHCIVWPKNVASARAQSQPPLFTHTQGKVYVMYIAMENNKDFDNWMKLATVGPHCPQHVAQ